MCGRACPSEPFPLKRAAPESGRSPETFTAGTGRARDVLARLERYELDVFAEDTAKPEALNEEALEVAARRAGRRKAVAQASLFDLADHKVVEEIRNVDPESLSPEEAKELLRKLRDRLPQSGFPGRHFCPNLSHHGRNFLSI